MQAAWRALEAVSGAFDLARVVAQNQAEVTGSGPIAITTDEAQWYYAAGFRLQPKALRRWPADTPLLIRVEATVDIGRIGALFVADDLQQVLGTTDEITSADGDTALEIVVDPAPRSGWLILRNNAAGKASRCQVRTIRTFQAGRELPGGVSRLNEVTGRGGATIDLGKLADAAARVEADMAGDGFLETARRKWSDVPSGLASRTSTQELAQLSDNELWRLWNQVVEESSAGAGFAVRGWYHELYRDILRGKRVLDVGSGFGIDGVTFARAGADVTFLDIARTNLEVVERLCRIAGIPNARFHYLQDLSSLDALPPDYDVIWCQGSMIHAPFAFARREAEALLRHLKPRGRWIELAYPRERWEREGRLPFREWGIATDGERTPWAEWYDLDRLRQRLIPAEFDVVLHFNFHQDDFNWFDLVRRT